MDVNQESEIHVLYSKLIGHLMCLVCISELNVMPGVSYQNQFVDRPKHAPWKAGNTNISLPRNWYIPISYI